MVLCWRFRTPIVDRPCRVVFAGPHFAAALELTRAVLERRGHSLSPTTATTNHTNQTTTSRIELIHAPTDEQLWQVAPTADVAIPFMQRFTADWIQRASRLRLIQQYGVGLEGVDVPTATSLGIAVSNIPAARTGNAEATAEHALLLSLNLLRQTTTELPRRLRDGQLGGLPPPRVLYRKNVTVVGYGAVGSKVCEYFGALGANVTAVRRDWSKSSAEGSLEQQSLQKLTSLQQALPNTDILILCCTMTPETLYMINNETLSLLPKTALVVNMGRGPLVEYTAIRRAIEDQRIAGFASDVGVGGHPEQKPSEPWDPDDPLTRHAHTIFTPHVGGYTDYSYGLMAEHVVDAIENVMAGRPPSVWVNRE